MRKRPPLTSCIPFGRSTRSAWKEGNVRRKADLRSEVVVVVVVVVVAAAAAAAAAAAVGWFGLVWLGLAWLGLVCCFRVDATGC